MKEHFRRWLRDEMSCPDTSTPLAHWLSGEEFVLFRKKWTVSLFQDSQTHRLLGDAVRLFQSATMWGGGNKPANWMLGKLWSLRGPLSVVLRVICVVASPGQFFLRTVTATPPPTSLRSGDIKVIAHMHSPDKRGFVEKQNSSTCSKTRYNSGFNHLGLHLISDG